MKDSHRSLLRSLALALYFLAIVMAGIGSVPDSYTEASRLTAESAFISATETQAIPVHFASAETGAVETLVRLKNLTLGFKLPDPLTETVTEAFLKADFSREDPPIQFLVRQIIFPFHSFW